MSATKPVINLADVPLHEIAHGEAFAAKVGRIGPMIGSPMLGCLLHVVPPGKRAFPFHAHSVAHELFVVLSGTGEYRFGAETYPVRAGDVLAAPAGGPEVAHQIINTGNEDLRYLGFSTHTGTEVVDYPDSNKFAMYSGSPDGSPMTARIAYVGRVANSLDYWEGEGATAKDENTHA
jgi:uncharacterized cupin superfamily protein